MSLAQNLNNVFETGKQVLLLIDSSNYEEVKFELESLGHKCLDKLFIDDHSNKKSPSADYPLSEWLKARRAFKVSIINSVAEGDAVFFSCLGYKAEKALGYQTCPTYLLDALAPQLEDVTAKVIVVIDKYTQSTLINSNSLTHEYAYGWRIVTHLNTTCVEYWRNHVE